MDEPERDQPKKAKPNAWLKPLLEIGPLFVFFIAYSKWDIYVATGVFMATSVTSLAISYAREKALPKMLLVSTVLVLILGGLTIWLKNETFIKLKLTIINALFGTVLLVGLWMGKLFVKPLLGTALRLTDEGWRKFTWRWIGYFAFIAGLNEVVWRSLSTDAWVKFKTFALPILSVAFFVALVPLINRYEMREEEPAP